MEDVYKRQEQYKNYYEGYSNSTLWPLCHYFFAYTSVSYTHLDVYKRQEFFVFLTINHGTDNVGGQQVWSKLDSAVLLSLIHISIT